MAYFYLQVENNWMGWTMASNIVLTNTDGWNKKYNYSAWIDNTGFNAIALDIGNKNCVNIYHKIWMEMRKNQKN